MLVPFLGSFAMALLAVAAFRLSWRRTRGRRKVKATVVSLSVGAAKAGSGYGISPIFEYADAHGHLMRAACIHHGKHTFMPKLGDSVEVYVDVHRPQYATLERPQGMWLSALVLTLLAGLFLYIGMLEM